MKISKCKPLIAAAMVLFFAFSARGQVIIMGDNLRSRMSEVTVTVLDSLTSEPLPFASMYLVPVKDTAITNFTLTDAEGKARLSDVPYGGYTVHVEMMGFKPYVKEHWMRKRKEDLGEIRLRVDEQFINAAVVSDIGNPIVIKKDTVEFNASSFKVGSNAMLRDLLKRMPGIEITEDGKVKFNGEAIDRLTVGGRTFFFGDQSMALNNLPASIVDKIRIIDRDSQSTRITGVQDGTKEKVMDVGLKKEYQEGWFGNAGLKGGTTIADGNDEFRDNRGMLYNGNALVSGYTEKDQITVIANALNVGGSGNNIVGIVDEDGSIRVSDGLASAAQIGVNANTTRIPNTISSNFSANYKYGDVISGNKSFRTTFQEGGNLYSSAEKAGRNFTNSFASNVEIEGGKGDFWFYLHPDIKYIDSDMRSSNTAVTKREDTEVNSSEGSSMEFSFSRSASIDAKMAIRGLGKDNRRVLDLAFDGFFSDNGGKSYESSSLTTSSGTVRKDLDFVSEGLSWRAGGSVRLTEPLGEKWVLSASGYMQHSRSGSSRDASEGGMANAYYSSATNAEYTVQRYELTTQYKMEGGNYVSVGATLNGSLQETFSKSFGIEKTTGEGEWSWFLTPTLRLISNKAGRRYYASIQGREQRPSASSMLPVLDITDPSRLSMGNVYLKPYGTVSFNASISGNNPKRFSSIMLYGYGQINYNGIGQAQWYDADGILYSVPVNIRKPAYMAALMTDYTTPLGEKKIWSIHVGGGANFSYSSSYQARSSLAGLDKDSFDYGSFMATFWGDSSGDRFYSGLSGFEEGRTSSFMPSLSVGILYNAMRFRGGLGASTTGRISRYSLDSRADMRTLDSRIGVFGSYTTGNEYEFNSELYYVFYRGYAEGYGQPEWQWNAEISKNIGAFNLSLQLHDILDQTRNLTHTVSANYEEDSYRLVLGRYFLIGLKWNFGKMNAAQNRRAMKAARDMSF